MGVASLLAVVVPARPAAAGLFGAQGLEGATALSFSPDGAYAYVAGESADAVSVLTRDASTGILTFVEAQFDGVGGVQGLSSPEWVIVSPDGAHVYAQSAAFSRDGGTGALTFLGTTGVGEHAAALSPDGAHLYAVGDGADVSVYTRNAGSGALTLVGTHPAGLGARAVAVSPDGAHVYVAGDERLVALERNVSTGSLTFIEEEIGFGLEDVATGLAVSPDGASVYATSYAIGFVDSALIVFARNASTGELTFVQDVVGPFFIHRGVAVTPDGMNVYSAVGVAVYDRNPVTGVLGFEGSTSPGFSSSSSVTLSPDGAHVYLTSASKVFVFSRDAQGAVTLVAGQFGGEQLIAGSRLTIENLPSIPERRAGTWLAVDPGVVAPERDFARGAANDPSCAFGQPAGTVNASIRFFSDQSGGSTQDTGEMPLPCQNWKALGTENNPTGFKYRDGSREHGPCKSIQVRDGKRLKARCISGPTTDLPYDLTEGIDEGVVNVVLTLGALKFCTAFDGSPSKDGSDGRRFQGEDAPAPASCPAPLPSASGAFVDLASGPLE